MNDAKRATPVAELERQICSSTEPKNEREWWAYHEIERLRARITELEAQCESAHAAQRHAETELAQYMAWYAMAEHQHLQEEARAERAEADAEVGRRWRDDSSLEAWFPYTAQELASLKDERDQLRAAIEQAPHERDCKKQRSLIADCNCWKADALRAARGGE